MCAVHTKFQFCSIPAGLLQNFGSLFLFVSFLLVSFLFVFLFLGIFFVDILFYVPFKNFSLMSRVETLPALGEVPKNVIYVWYSGFFNVSTCLDYNTGPS